MSVTEDATRATRHGRAHPSPPTSGGASGDPVVLGPPPKLRRRPLLTAASVLAVLVGALVSAFAYTSTNSAREVLAVTSTVYRGEVIERGDVAAVRVGVDPALHPVPASQLERVVGERAATDLPAGGLVTDNSIGATVVPGRDLSVVGVALPNGLLPAEPLQVGDAVRIVATPGQQGDLGSGKPPTVAAIVVGVHRDDNAGQTVVDVQVPANRAAELAARSATGKVALVLDSRER